MFAYATQLSWVAHKDNADMQQSFSDIPCAFAKPYGLKDILCICGFEHGVLVDDDDRRFAEQVILHVARDVIFLAATHWYSE